MELNMALIKSNLIREKVVIDIKMNCDVIEQIIQYCNWANIKNIGFFIEESAEYFLSKKKIKPNNNK